MTAPTAPRAGDTLLLGFEGTTLPADIADLLRRGIGVGVTLFRALNVEGPAQLRELTEQVRRAAGRPVLVCGDQETGQLLGLGAFTTPFAGNLAMGAAGDLDLTRQVGRAIGIEVRALGVDVDYAPVCDLLTNPDNPNLGARCFGDDPAAVAEHVTAFVGGLVDVGAAAAAKHFPGKGDAAVDSHHALPTLPWDLPAMQARELVPFQAALDAGAGMVMTAHAAYPAITGRPDLPATLSRAILHDLLRTRMGFEGVVVTDALDMKALGQGARQVVDAIAALRAGADLVLGTAQAGMTERLVEGLDAAVSRDLLGADLLASAAGRVHRLAGALTARPRPDLDVVGGPAHADLADELARAAVTLVADPGGLLPLPAASRVLAVMPRPVDRTPADTSSLDAPLLADVLAERFASVEPVVVDIDPDPAAVAAVVDLAGRCDAVVLGTIDAFAHPGQVALARALSALDGVPLVTAALRVPTDVDHMPEQAARLATYAIHAPSLGALADVVAGRRAAPGRLPIATARHPRGHRWA